MDKSNLSHQFYHIILSQYNKVNNSDEFLILLEKVLEIFNIKQKISKHKYHEYLTNPDTIKESYSFFKLTQKNNKQRIIQAPKDDLKIIQKAIALLLQTLYPVTEVSTGFVWGKSVVDNAKKHVKKTFVYNIDLKDFFSNITDIKIKSALIDSSFGLHQEKEWLNNSIISLCCVPNQSEQSQNIDTTYRLILPQGSPSSPILSNIAMKTFDKRLILLTKDFDVVYTRYVDDMTFSANKNVFKKNNIFKKSLINIINEEGFEINPLKNRLSFKGQKQQVTGLVVNQKVNTRRSFVKDIRRWLYLWEQYGYDKAQKIFLNNYVKKTINPRLETTLEGKINFLKLVKGKENSTYTNLRDRYIKCADKTGEGQQPNPDEKDEKAPYVNEIERPTLSDGEVLLDFHDFEKSFKEGDVVQTILMQGTKNDKPTLLEVAFYGDSNRIIGFREPSETNMTEEEIEKLPKFNKNNLGITPLQKLKALKEGRLFERTITKASNKRQIEWSSDEFTITDTIEKVRNAQWNPQTTAVFHGFSIDTDAKSRFKGRLKLHLLTFSVNKMFNKGSLDNKKRFVAALELLMYGTSVPNSSMLMDEIIELVENINKTTEPENALEMAKLNIVQAQVNGLVTQKRNINRKPFIQVNAPKLTENHPDVVVIKEFYETVKRINDALDNEKLPFVQFGDFEEVFTASITLTTGDKTRSISYNPHRIFIETLQYMERGNNHTAFFKNLDSKKEMLGDTLETAENIKIAIEKAAEVISKDEKGKELYKQLKTTTNVQGDKIETVGAFFDASPTTENAKTRKVVEYTDVTLNEDVEKFVAKHIEQGWSLVAIEGLEDAYDLRKVVRINIDSNQETGTVEVVLSIPIDANYGKILQEHPVTFKIFKLGANQERTYGTLKKGIGLTGSNLIFNPASHPDILNDMYEDTQVMDSDPESIKTLLAYINTNLLQGGIRGKKQVRGAVNEAIYNMSRKNNKVKLPGSRRNNGKEIYVGLTNYLNDSVRKFDLDNVSALDFPSFTRNSYNNYENQKQEQISPMDVLESIISNYSKMYENIPVGATDNLYDSNLSTTNAENTKRVDDFMENKSTNVQDIVESFVVLSDSTVVNPPQTQNETQTSEEVEVDDNEKDTSENEKGTENPFTGVTLLTEAEVLKKIADAKEKRRLRPQRVVLSNEEEETQRELDNAELYSNAPEDDPETKEVVQTIDEDSQESRSNIQELEEVEEETDSEEQVEPSSTKDATLSSSRIESTSEGSKSFKFTMSVKLTKGADDSSNNAFKLIVFLEIKALIPKIKLTEEQEKQLTDKVLDYIETNKTSAYTDIGLKYLKIQANKLLAEEVLKMFSEPGVINQTELKRLQNHADIQIKNCPF